MRVAFDREIEFARVIVLFGAFGSGKSEIALNLAHRLRAQGHDTALVDADYYKPLFRSGGFKNPLEKRGIRVILPPGELAHADVTALPPEIYGVIETGPNVVFDVGGETGARVLGALAGRFRPGSYETLLVVNTRRPDARTADALVDAAERMKAISRLPVAGLAANTNLGPASTIEVAREGYQLAAEAARRLGVPVKFVALDEGLMDRLSPDDFPLPVLPVRRYLLPPWEVEEED